MPVNESVQPDLKVNQAVSALVHSKQSFGGTLYKTNKQKEMGNTTQH